MKMKVSGSNHVAAVCRRMVFVVALWSEAQGRKENLHNNTSATALARYDNTTDLFHAISGKVAFALVVSSGSTATISTTVTSTSSTTSAARALLIVLDCEANVRARSKYLALLENLVEAAVHVWEWLLCAGCGIDQD